MYAIHIADLMALQRAEPALSLVLTQYVGDESVEIDRQQFDGVALPLTCGDEQAAALVELIRRKYRREQVRIWNKGQKGGWKRV